MPRVLIATIGSYGDLHPYLAIGRVLKAEGWEVVFATPTQYRGHAERLGFRYVAIKPSLEDLGPEEKWVAKANDSVRGGEYVIKDFVMPYLETNYQVCYDAAEGCDLVISHMITFSAPIAAEKRGIPWISTLLQPSLLFSAYDPPTLGPVPFLPKLKVFGPWGPRIIYRLMERSTMSWFKPVIELRAKLGLPPLTANPLFRGFSPRGTIALFPEALVSRQSDWPPRLRQVGFPLFDDAQNVPPSPELLTFLRTGPPPVAFTLGSAVVRQEGPFFKMAYEAVKQLGVRAVFLVGEKSHDLPSSVKSDPRILLSPYEPFSALFPHSSAIVHQCGVGTTAQALASGRPQVLVPFAHDQPDNAARVKALGIGLVIPATKLSVENLRSSLKTILSDGKYAASAREFSEKINARDFPKQLVGAIEELRS